MASLGIVAPKPQSLVNLTLPVGQEDCDPHANLTLEPDRDIGGRGVIASFVGSGCLALIIVTIYYLFVFDPKVTQFPDRKRTFNKRRTTSLSTHETVRWATEDYVPPNPVDEYMYELQVRLYRTVKWRPSWLPGKPKIEEAFRRCILGLSDLQILTGLCVLIAGFSAIETIPAYYWQLIVYVAWFSNLTHQCGLIFLRRYLHRKPWERGWRIVLITVLIILLIIAMIPSMYFNWHNNGIYDLLSRPASAAQPATPMKCFYNHETRHYMHEKTFGHPNTPLKFAATRAFQNVLISLVFLITSYATRVIKLFNSSSTFFRYQVRGRAGYSIRKFFAWTLWKFDAVTRHRIGPQAWFLFIESPLLTLYFCFRVLLDIYASVISDVGWLYAGTLLGMWRLVAEKEAELDFVEDPAAFKAEDRLMDFGQLLPLMLLASPIFATIGTFSHRSVSDAAVPSERIRVVEGLDDENHQVKAIVAANRNFDLPRTGTALEQPSVKDKVNRWNRIHHVLEDEKYWAAPWFSSALFTVCIGELSIFLVVYINLVISRGARTVFFQGLLAILSILPLSTLPIQVGVALRGWSDKKVARLCWAITAPILGTYAWVCYRYAVAGDFFTMYVSVGVAVGAYYILCMVFCMLPKSWTRGQSALKDEEGVASSTEIVQASRVDAARDVEESASGPGTFSRSTTFRLDGAQTFRLESEPRRS